MVGVCEVGGGNGWMWCGCGVGGCVDVGMGCAMCVGLRVSSGWWGLCLVVVWRVCEWLGLRMCLGVGWLWVGLAGAWAWAWLGVLA